MPKGTHWAETIPGEKIGATTNASMRQNTAAPNTHLSAADHVVLFITAPPVEIC